MKNFNLKVATVILGFSTLHTQASLAAERSTTAISNLKRATASSSENDVTIELQSKKRGTLLVGEFLDKNKKSVELTIERNLVGEPAATPLHISAKVKFADREEAVKIVSDLKVCEFDGAVYNPEDNAVYFLLREKNVSEECSDKFSLKFPL